VSEKPRPLSRKNSVALQKSGRRRPKRTNLLLKNAEDEKRNRLRKLLKRKNTKHRKKKSV
jgi:hypothetical protein